MYTCAEAGRISKHILCASTRSVSQFTKNSLMRREQAKRSLLIKFPGRPVRSTLKHVLQKCERHGKVVNMFSWENAGVPVVDTSCVLVEFESRSALENIHKSTLFFPDHTGFEMPTRQLYYTMYGEMTGTNLNDCKNIVTEKADSIEQLHQQLMEASSLSRQIELVHRHDKMTETALRLRHFICSDIEEVLNGMLSSCYILPFGSTVNGFGKSDGDLDMVLMYPDVKRSRKRPGHFYYLSKGGLPDARLQATKALTLISGVIQALLPSYVRVENILRARVPIVKFTNQSMDIECDLSVENRDCLHMSELLYNLATSEPRLPQLLFTLKKWAYTHDVIGKGATQKLSTFMLIMLTVHFLQTQRPQALPPLNSVVSFNVRYMEPIIKPVGMRTQNRQDLGTLLKEFFKYYADFNFDRHGIDMLHGKPVAKPVSEEHRPMYVKNPILHEHNVCQNVLDRELRNFQTACLNSHLALAKNQSGKSHSGEWGVLNIMDLLAERKPASPTGTEPERQAPENEDQGPMSEAVKLT